MGKALIHHDGYWSCVADGKNVKDWKQVNCKECLNDRHNHEVSMQVGYAAYILNGLDLKKLQDDLEKRNPEFKKFREENHSKEMNAISDRLYEISLKTKRITTTQERLDYVRSLSEKNYGNEKYLIVTTAHNWFREIK